MSDQAVPRWHTSTRSGGNGGNCIEVATNVPAKVFVRDSKDRDGPTLAFAPRDWQTFVRGVDHMEPLR